MFSKLRKPTLTTSLLAAALLLGANQAMAGDKSHSKDMIKDVKDMGEKPVVQAESLEAESQLSEEELKEMIEEAEAKDSDTSSAQEAAE